MEAAAVYKHLAAAGTHLAVQGSHPVAEVVEAAHSSAPVVVHTQTAAAADWGTVVDRVDHIVAVGAGHTLAAAAAGIGRVVGSFVVGRILEVALGEEPRNPVAEKALAVDRSTIAGCKPPGCIARWLGRQLDFGRMEPGMGHLSLVHPVHHTRSQ